MAIEMKIKKKIRENEGITVNLLTSYTPIPYVEEIWK